MITNLSNSSSVEQPDNDNYNDKQRSSYQEHQSRNIEGYASKDTWYKLSYDILYVISNSNHSRVKQQGIILSEST